MASANVHEFTDDNFQAEVLSSDQPVLVDFWAEWCMPCRMLAPTIEELADDFAGKVKVGKFDIDQGKQVATQFGISAIPTVILFVDGKPAKKFVGLKGKDDFAAALNEAVGA